jgi:formylglycine-generating enzyme required for sulfatase activity
MDLLTTLVSTLAGKLAEKAFMQVAGELPPRIKRIMGGDPTALQKCFIAGFEAALKEMRAPTRERLQRYADLVNHFLEMPEVSEELAKLVDVGAITADPTRALDLARLNDAFTRAYPIAENPEAYTGLNFPAALRAFARAYTAALERQADQFPWIQIGLLKELVARVDARPTRNTLREMYLDWLARDCDLLPLSLDPKEATPGAAKATLREVYVPLDVASLPKESKKQSRKTGTPTIEQFDPDARAERVPALRALAGSRLAVLLGDPGSGKTTLINYLALCLAMHELDPDAGWLAHLEDWQPGALLPVRVVLRHFANDAIPANAQRGNAGMLWKYLEDETEQHGYKEFFADLRAELLNQGGLILLDGLDEVPDSDGRRARVCEAILDFALTAKQCRCIVTCRTYAYPRNPLAGFDAFPITRFSPEQIETFIDRWHDAVREKELWSLDEARAQADALKIALDPQRKPALADLATRPLLLTLMAMLSTSAQGKLPEDRADLYEQCVELLIENWQRRKIIRDATGKSRVEGGLLEEVGIEKAALRRALHRLAFDAHARQGKHARGAQTADIQPAELEMILKPAVGGEEKFNLAVEYIKNRAGLIYWRDPTYTFPHRSFQEYLAACHLGNLGNYLEETRRLVREDAEWWREVFLLEAGRQRAHLGTAIALVDALCRTDCEKIAQPQTIDWQSAILAGQALVELRLPQQIEEKRKQNEDVELFETPLNRVRCWLGTLLETMHLTPQERADAGIALGWLSDPRADVTTPFPVLVPVPGGTYWIGDDKKYERERPRHQVTLTPFWIGKYPVTNAQFEHFIDAKGYDTERFWTPAGWNWRQGKYEPDLSHYEDKDLRERVREWIEARKERGQPEFWKDRRWNISNHPVVGVTWFEAMAYCAWLTAKLKVQSEKLKVWQDGKLLTFNFELDPLAARLPTEVEWEAAARGAQENVWPWGNTFDAKLANTFESEIKHTTAVGQYPAGESPFFARDMAGNVWEWCRTLYQPYPYQVEDGRENLKSDKPRVLRGGSWIYRNDLARGAYRSVGYPVIYRDYVGFRVVVSSSLNSEF